MNFRHRVGCQLGDKLFNSLTLTAATLVLILLAALLIGLVIGAWPALSTFGLNFFISDAWNPVTQQYGALTTIYGTVMTSAIALLIAAPLSIGIAFFLTELAPGKIRKPVSTAIELLAAMPSIISGMWGLFIFAP